MPRKTQVTQTPWATQGSCHETLSSMSGVSLHGLPRCPSFGGADLFPKINPSGLLPSKEDFSSCLSIPATAALPLRALVTALASDSSSAQQQVTAEILLPPANPPSLCCPSSLGGAGVVSSHPRGTLCSRRPHEAATPPSSTAAGTAGGTRAARATRAEAALQCKSQTPSAPCTGKGLKPLPATAAPLINETRERLRTKRMAQHINPSLMQGL